MRRITNGLAVLLLGWGLAIVSLAALKLQNADLEPRDRQEVVAALLLFGGLPLTAGSWLTWQQQHQAKQQERDRLRSLFFELLRHHHGQITPLQLAKVSGLDGKAAIAYLNQQALEFDALYQVNENGRISYFFDLGLEQEQDLNSSTAQIHPSEFCDRQFRNPDREI